MTNTGWKPNRLSHTPLHKQIEDYIKEKILNGEWPIGTRIPSQRALAKAFGVNRSTVVTAFEELAASGLIAGKTGGGTKVVNNTWNLLASSPTPDWNTYVSSGIYQPNRAMIQRINEAEFHPHIIRLGTGELSPQLLPAVQLEHIFQKASRKGIFLGYEEPKGNLLLREQLAKYLKGLNIHTSPSSILIVSGALQALQLVSIGLLKKGSTILLEKPSYLYSIHVFQSAGMKLYGIPMDKEGMEISLIQKYKKETNGALLYTIPSFHNPTGIMMTESRRKELISVCQEERLPVIEDDVYRDLWIDHPPPSPLKANDHNGNVLYVGSMSKSVSPGLRIGWIVGLEQVINRLADIKMQTDYGSSSLSQIVAAQWYSSGIYVEHLNKLRAELKIRRDTMLNALKNYFSEIATWNVPKGGFYIWLRLCQPFSFRRLFDQALKAGILLNPGHLYDQAGSECCIRISYSHASLKQIEFGMRKLAEIIKTLE
ncbi:PLP-dependent aminotransferase family protein [Bacillus aquiflavi]|uniref:PLP-dependent aminotransferase family protein n=1 Tax=Bacillus aquiflavi TaxID=2672567 RepID=A0A6B3VV43_9BACI|nr:PLP-dependent aminotransferase family protein [Bacillus aquiflavi]MBA4536761.1 PLP-dependent aminotransferase family protein [Bacillus aquiflavi]NEY81128.1 PLP-dependent aminotransferase family protein [Bacillus aquiflavi]UAC49691.1 PLP-dependent aminotransferase family protein [Bacillus aquiflavi]